MAIAFACPCGRPLRAKDELAGKRAKCPDCGSIVVIPPAEGGSSTTRAAVAAAAPAPAPRREPAPAPKPSPAFDPDDPFDDEDDSPYGVVETPPRPGARPEAGPDRVATSPNRPRPVDQSRSAASAPSKPAKAKAKAGESSILEYTYLLLVVALIPLVFSLLGKSDDRSNVERIAESMAKASPEQQKKLMELISSDSASDAEVFAALPGGRLFGAHLPRDTTRHWVYAAIAATAYLLLLGAMFSVERVNAAALLAVGAFTATAGIVFLFAVQLCSNIDIKSIRGRGVGVIFLVILALIGLSYRSADDPESNFFLSALGFTFGVGFCEEFAKALPLFFALKRHSDMGWRAAFAWGLASGIGFGVSEGIMYSSRYYNGIGGGDIYLVRFVSCVALHAMWSAAVGISMARNVDHYESIDDAAGFGLFALKILAVPMTLHGFYDTLLKKDMNGGALLVALLSYGWLAFSVEMARAASPGAGRRGLARA